MKNFLQIRNQLDEIKRRELERLRHLAMRQYEMQNGIDKRHIKIPQHIEIQHPRFEIEDLKKLIKTTTKDLVIVKFTQINSCNCHFKIYQFLCC